MSKILIGVLSLIAGAILGVVVLGPVLVGGAAGIGIATGLSAGVCATMTAAQEEGLLSTEQVDQILTRAASDLAEMSGKTLDGEIVGSIDKCGNVMEQIRNAN